VGLLKARFGLALLLMFAAASAWAQVFLSLPEALSQGFGNEITLVQVPLDQLTKPQLELLKTQAGSPLNAPVTRCYQGQAGNRVIGYLCLDNMIGKTEYITYLVGPYEPA